MVDINITTNSMLPITPKEVGKTSDGKIIYETKYPNTGSTTKFTIPEENQDKFEKLVYKVHEKYGKYDVNPEKKFAKAAHLATLSGAIIGGALTASLIKTKSKMGKFAKTIGGAIGGVVIASLALAGSIIYPMIKYTKEIKNMGYKPLKESPMIKETKEEEENKIKEKELPKTEKE